AVVGTASGAAQVDEDRPVVERRLVRGTGAHAAVRVEAGGGLVVEEDVPGGAGGDGHVVLRGVCGCGGLLVRSRDTSRRDACDASRARRGARARSPRAWRCVRSRRSRCDSTTAAAAAEAR